MTLPLIDTAMYFDTVLNALVQLLKDESTNQGNIGGSPWITVKERFDPWNSITDGFPVANVVYNSGSFDESRGSHSDQTQSGSYFIDCYASAYAFDDGSEITPKDQRAAEALHLLITQIYYSIMAESNRDIGLPAGKIVSPWINRIEKFQPVETGVPVEGIIAARLTLSMVFKEYPPIGTGQPLNIVNVNSVNTDDNTLVEQTFDNLQS